MKWLSSIFCKLFDHVWEDWQVSTNKCIRNRKCSRCLQVQTEIIPHTWNDWEVSTTKCEQSRKCSHCLETEASLLPHKWNEWTTTTQNKQQRNCSHCTAVEFREIHVCEQCNGSGNILAVIGTEQRECPSCQGKGYFEIDPDSWTEWDQLTGTIKFPDTDSTCSACDGKGYVYEQITGNQTCPNCKGEGIIYLYSTEQRK